MIPILDYASTVWNPHTHKNSIDLNEYKTVVLAGFVAADFVLGPINGLNHLRNAVQSYYGHFFPPDVNICH